MRKLNEEDREAVYRESIEQYGVSAQVDMAIEEMAELTKALLKFRRFGWSENSSDYLENIYANNGIYIDYDSSNHYVEIFGLTESEFKRVAQECDD